MTTKRGKPSRPADKIQAIADAARWVKPLSAAKKSPARAKPGSSASLKRELASTAATSPEKASAGKKSTARSGRRASRPSKPAHGAGAPASADATRPAAKLVLVKSGATVAAARSDTPPAVLDESLSEVRTLLSSGRASREAWSGSLAESASEASRGFAEINGKLLDLMRAQTDATLSLWRAMLGAHSMGEAVGLQASEMRRQFETTATHVSDIVATTNRVAVHALKPMQAFGERTRRAS